MSHPTIALVTGANHGLGLALVEGLADRLGPDDHVFLTGRSPDRVAAEAQRLARPPQWTPPQEPSQVRAAVHGLVLDVTDEKSVQAAADLVAERYGGIDVVVANAGTRTTPGVPPADEVDQLVETNNLGAIRVLRSFGPLVRAGGRMLVVASGFGRLGHLDPALRPRFDDARSLAGIEAVLESWRAAVHAGTASAQGWPEWLNIPSKVAQVASVRVVAAQRRIADLADGTLVAAVCPGLIDTGASRPWFTDMSGAQTPAQAATAVLDLILAAPPDPSQYGELIQFGRVLSWRDEIAETQQAAHRVRAQ
jgi:carbonyl reductase 1